MNRKIMIPVIVLAVLVTSFYVFSKPPVPDFTGYIDKRIETSNEQFDRFDALEYFKDGGHYVDSGDDPEEVPFDQPYVVPLVDALESEYGFDFYVLARPQEQKSEPRTGVELIADIPPGVSRTAIKETLSEYGKKTPGFIVQEWGTNALSLDFLREDEAKALGLDKLKK